MKKLFIPFVVFIFFAGFINAQSKNENIKQSNINRVKRYPMSVKMNSRKNKVKAILYKPIKATSDIFRYTYAYDNSGNCISELEEELTNSDWVNKTRRTYTYNNSGNCLTELDENWSNGIWSNYWRYTYTYNNSGNCIIMLEGDSLSGTWQNDWRSTYTYDNSNNCLSFLLEGWSDGWVKWDSSTYTYDNSGNLLTQLDEFADRLNGTWSIEDYYVYAYDSLGNCLTEIEQNTWMWVFTYDNSGNCITELDIQWSDNKWEDRYRYTYTYDNSGNCLSELDEYWTNSDWINTNKYTYIYDSNSNGVHGESLQWQNSFWIPSQDNLILFYNNHSEYSIYIGSIVDVEYSSLTTGITRENLNIKTFNLSQNYPNPFNPTTKIEYSIPQTSFVTLKVYDVLGKEVAALVNEEKSVGNYNLEFYGNQLPSGIYFYKIQAGSYSSVKKMILIK